MVLQCSREQDCCWGGKDAGPDGCINQHNGFDQTPCLKDSYVDGMLGLLLAPSERKHRLT